MQSVRGRILYDFTGSACEGYALQFRQVSQLDTGEGRVVVSDLRATTWEEGQGRASDVPFGKLHRRAAARIRERRGASATARRSRSSSCKPEEELDVDCGLVFPTQHVRRLLAAAKAGQTILEVGVYDGSENGEKIYDTLTVIGRRIGARARSARRRLRREPALDGLARWPVTVSYFDRPRPAASRRRSIRSASSCTRTASRAR